MTTKYIDLLYERFGKLAIEEIEYSDYDGSSRSIEDEKRKSTRRRQGAD